MSIEKSFGESQGALQVLSSSTGSGTVDYAKLKKELLFHEKRLHLLLSSKVVEDLPYLLKERQDSRWNCFECCKAAISDLERNAAAEGSLSGRWSETRIASLFGLELPLSVVICSEKFERPTLRADEVAKLLDDVQALSKRFSEHAPPDEKRNQVDTSTFLKELHSLQWSPQDMVKMRNAITSKLAVLTELTELRNAMKDSQYQVSVESLKLEKLRRDEEQAVEDGEMALSDALIRERMQVTKRIIDHLFFQAHTIDSSVDSNLSKKRSNLTLFREGTAALSFVRKEKERVMNTCRQDAQRITRGLQYDEKQRADSRSLTMLQESRKRLEALDDRQKVLSEHLERVVREFCEVEQAIQQLGEERHQALKDHVDLLDSRRHLNSDTNEKIRFAEVYQKNLTLTEEENQRAIEALGKLENLLLKQTTFDEYDFQATAQRLKTMQRRVAVELNRALNEYEAAGAELMRRLSAQLKVLTEETVTSEVEAEIHKETFDPITKKFVMRAREFGSRRDKLGDECRQIRDAVESERQAILRRIQQHLDPSEIVDHRESVALLSAARSESLLDLRQELITPADVAILDERLRVAREFQSHMAQAPTRISKKLGASGGSAGAAATTNASRVLAIRDDVKRHHDGGGEDATAGGGGDADVPDPDVSAVTLPADADSTAPDADATGVSSSNVALSLEFSRVHEERSMAYRNTVRRIQMDGSTTMASNSSQQLD